MMTHRISLIALAIVCAANGLHAQRHIPIDGPRIGFEAGVSQDAQIGGFTDPCGCAVQDAKGTGFVAFVLFESPTPFGIRAGVRAGVEMKHLYLSVPLNEEAVLQGHPSSKLDTVVALPVNWNTDITITYLTTEPYVHYKLPWFPLFFEAGTSVSGVISSNLRQTRETTNHETFQNGTSIEELSDTTIHDLQTRVAIVASMGYEFEVMGMSLSPTLTYESPLTDVQSSNSWRISSVIASLAFKFSL